MSVRDQLSSEGSKAPTSQIDTPSSSKKKRKRSASKELGQSSGRWTRAEHEAFLVGLKECGREWKKVAMRIPTRTSAQIRSHAQKYFAKIQRDQDSMVVDTTHHHLVAPVVATSPNVTPSVARNIERILADPMAAQQEVQNTMEALRERYRQLQLRLGRRQQNHLSSLGRLVEPEDSIKQRSIDALQQQMMDDHSSVSSNVSSAVASLANEELIALHVLGETLSRGGENNSSVATAEALPEDEARGETNHKEESRKN
jgi:SHAQKYF class myb-like DNA-binding protein